MDNQMLNACCFLIPFFLNVCHWFEVQVLLLSLLLPLPFVRILIMIVIVQFH